MSGSRGPKSTPTAILEKRGSRAIEVRKDVEPVPPEGKPSRRGIQLSAKARRVWDRLCPVLYEMGVLKISNEDAFARYCELSAMWKDATAHIRKHGQLLPVIKMRHKEDGTTEPVIVGYSSNPSLKKAIEINAQLAKLDAEFGLTPAARARMSARVPKDALKSRSERAPGRRAKSKFFDRASG